MHITAFKTHKITVKDTNIFTILDTYLPKVKEKSVVAVTSKIVAICEGRLVSMDSVDKEELIKNESSQYIPSKENPYNISFAITHNILVGSAGVDESNGNGYYVLWPSDPQLWANKIREYLSEKYKLKNIGVVITDSKTTPLRWGVTAYAIAHSGFNALKNYAGKPDLFGRLFQYEKLNIADSLATSAAVVMGEGIEQTPLAVIEDIPFVQFQGRNPTQEEVELLKISIDEDIYGPFLRKAKWKKGNA